MSDEEVQKVLVLQEESMTKFGEIAIELSLANADQINLVLKEGEKEYTLIGQALVKLGVIEEKDMVQKFEEYETLCKANDPKVSKITLF